MPAQPAHAVPIDIIATARRVEERAQLLATVSLHLGAGESLPATLIDLTTRGCRIKVGNSVVAGSHVTLTANAMMVGGAVAWSTDQEAGIEFGARLMPKALRAFSR